MSHGIRRPARHHIFAPPVPWWDLCAARLQSWILERDVSRQIDQPFHRTCHTCGVACVHMPRSNQMSKGASGSIFFTIIDLFYFINSFQGILRVHFRELGRHPSHSLCHSIQAFTTTSQVGSSRRLLPVGILPVPTRKSTRPSPLGHPLLLCLGRVHCWRPQPLQKGKESQWHALQM